MNKILTANVGRLKLQPGIQIVGFQSDNFEVEIKRKTEGKKPKKPPRKAFAHANAFFFTPLAPPGFPVRV